MSGQDQDRRTHHATPRRELEFRRRGEVALSRDTSAIATLIGGSFFAYLLLERSVRSLEILAVETFGNLSQPTFGPALDLCARTVLLIAFPILIGALLGYGVSAAAQLGFPPAFAAPKVDLLRPFSWSAVSSVLSFKAALGRGGKAVAKTAVVLLAAVVALRAEAQDFSLRPALSAAEILARAGSGLSSLLFHGGGALFCLGLLEYVLAKRSLNARMRMTTEEVKREMRDQEGDPLVRRHRKQRMRELAKRRLKVAVKKADVVLVNPTEYAVALSYRPGGDRAPRVVAKGRRRIAEQIRSIARSEGVPIVARPPLTRLLYRLVPEGKEIPAQAFSAVAEVLAFVYRIRNARLARRDENTRNR